MYVRSLREEINSVEAAVRRLLAMLCGEGTDPETLEFVAGRIVELINAGR